MMDYAKQIAEAVRRECSLCDCQHHIDDLDLDEIIASVPRPEPVGQLVKLKDFEGDWYSTVEWKRAANNTAIVPNNGSYIYTSPVSAEPVNARLLDAAKKYRDALQAEGRAKHGHGFTPATREYERNLSVAWQELGEAISAAEQAKPAPGEYYGMPLDDGLPAPELTDERIEQLAEKFYQPSEQFEGGIFFDRWGFARAIERELRGNLK